MSRLAGRLSQEARLREDARAERRARRTPAASSCASSCRCTARRGCTTIFASRPTASLASWAVPKGPTLVAGDRRLAMHVEDHPMDYRDFEGNIPKGEYGGGSVIVWDQGHVRAGRRRDPGDRDRQGQDQVRAARQEAARPVHAREDQAARGRERRAVAAHQRPRRVRRPDVRLADHPESVKSGKTIGEVAERSAREDVALEAEAGRAASSIKRGAACEARPDAAGPSRRCSRRWSDEPFDDDGWLFEIKWDGYRALCTIDEDGKVSLTSRNGKDLLAHVSGVDGARRRVPERADR